MVKNIYYGHDVPLEERERLRIFAYPHQLSCQAIGDVKGKTLLDVGAGPNLLLHEYVNQAAGSYVPLDINPQFLEPHLTQGVSRAIHGDVCSHKIQDEVFSCGFDIIHVRFLLMHLPGIERRKAIASLIEAAREKVVFLEYDWQSFQGRAAVNRFRDFTLGLAKLLKIDFYYGSKLGDEAAAAASTQVAIRVFQRPRGAYYSELIPLVKATRGFLEKSQASAKQKRQLEDIIPLINFEAELPAPPGFIPPAVVGAMVSK